MATFSVPKAIQQKLLTSLVIAAGVLLICGSVPAQVDKRDSDRTLTVTGIGEVRALPDLAEVRLGATTESPSVSDAASKNAAKVSAISNAMKKLGIPERDIQTSTYQIYPVRRFEPGANQVGEPPIVGYNVTNVLSVRTGNFALVPRIIDDSVRAGANTVQDVSFLLRDQTSANQSALKQAVANARRSAETMAGELGVKLVAVKNAQQGVANIVPGPMFARAASAEGGPATPIFPGEVAVNATVTLTYVIQ